MPGVELPPKDFVPRDLVDEEEEAVEEFEPCEGCMAPLTCNQFKHCIREDYE